MLYRPVDSLAQQLRLLFQRRVRDGQLAYLGDGTGRVEVPDRRGYVYARFPDGKDASGFAKFTPPFIVRASGTAFLNYEGAAVYVAVGYNGELQIVEAHYAELDRSGIDTRTFNPLHPQSHWVYLWQLTIGLCSAVATTTSDSFLVTIKKFRHYVNNRFQTFETGLQADKLDVSAHIPATDMHRYAVPWTDTYRNEAEMTTSTTQSLFTPLDGTDIQETVADRPPDAIPHKAIYLANNQGTVTQQAAADVDLRQFLNVPQIHGFTSPVTYRERIQPGRQVLFAGTLKVTKSLEVLGSLVGVPSAGGGESGGSSGAPDDATYIVQTPSSGLSAEQALSALATGLLKNTTGTGVLSTAVSNTDYVPPSGAILTSPTINTGVSGSAIDTDATMAANSDTVLASQKATRALVEGLPFKRIVRLGTSTVLPACTYANGSSGVGATLTADANGALSVDSTSVAANDRILVKDQASGLQNGIYTVTQTGSAGTPFILTRTTDADSSADILGMVVVALVGTVNLLRIFRCTNTSAITMGTTNITFAGSMEVQEAGSGIGYATVINFVDSNVDLASGLIADVYHNLPGIVNGRLTLTSGTPVTTADVTAATTVYFTPYKGNQISLYDGTRWRVYAYTERSIALPGTTSTNYDVFLYDNAGTLTLELVAWTNGTTRATDIVLQDGVYVKSGNTTRRYLGTVRTGGTSGQSEDSLTKRFCWNLYNAQLRVLRATDATNSWNYTSTTIRQANGSSANQVEVVVGVAGVIVDLILFAFSTNSGGAGIGIGENTTSAFTTGNTGMFIPSQAGASPLGVAQLCSTPAVGYSFYSWNERGNTSGVFFGDNNIAYLQSGMQGHITG